MIREKINQFNDTAEARHIGGVGGKTKLLLDYIVKNYLLSEMAAHAPNPLVPVIQKWRGVNVGRNVFIDRSVKIDDAFPQFLTIGDQVRITAGAFIITHISPGRRLRRSGILPFTVRPVTIKQFAFIGVNVVVLPGVTIGEGAVVGAGSVVTRDVEPYSLYAGNPARRIRRFPSKSVLDCQGEDL